MTSSTIIKIIELSLQGLGLIPGIKQLISSNRKEKEQLLRKYFNEVRRNKMQLDVINFDIKDFKHNKDVLYCIDKLNYEVGLEVNTRINELNREIKSIKKQQKKIYKNNLHKKIFQFINTPIKIQELKDMTEDDSSLLFKKCRPYTRLKNIKKSTDDIFTILSKYFSK